MAEKYYIARCPGCDNILGISLVAVDEWKRLGYKTLEETNINDLEIQRCACPKLVTSCIMIPNIEVHQYLSFLNGLKKRKLSVADKTKLEDLITLLSR